MCTMCIDEVETSTSVDRMARRNPQSGSWITCGLVLLGAKNREVDRSQSQNKALTRF
jgi:hypothetical protein